MSNYISRDSKFKQWFRILKDRWGSERAQGREGRNPYFLCRREVFSPKMAKREFRVYPFFYYNFSGRVSEFRLQGVGVAPPPKGIRGSDSPLPYAHLCWNFLNLCLFFIIRVLVCLSQTVENLSNWNMRMKRRRYAFCTLFCNMTSYMILTP